MSSIVERRSTYETACARMIEQRAGVDQRPHRLDMTQMRRGDHGEAQI